MADTIRQAWQWEKHSKSCSSAAWKIKLSKSCSSAAWEVSQKGGGEGGAGAGEGGGGRRRRREEEEEAVSLASADNTCLPWLVAVAGQLHEAFQPSSLWCFLASLTWTQHTAE